MDSVVSNVGLILIDFYESIQSPDREYSVNCCEGLSIDILQSLALDLGFDYQLYVVPDGKFGAFDSDIGNWTGMVKEVIDGG